MQIRMLQHKRSKVLSLEKEILSWGRGWSGRVFKTSSSYNYYSFSSNAFKGPSVLWFHPVNN